ncbi:MAG: hypothetical protein KAZ88_14370 [Acidimicrobiia bacterium]|nr:hypothetical protein [Acidimicrobiia bacterium]
MGLGILNMFGELDAQCIRSQADQEDPRFRHDDVCQLASQPALPLEQIRVAVLEEG